MRNLTFCSSALRCNQCRKLKIRFVGLYLYICRKKGINPCINKNGEWSIMPTYDYRCEKCGEHFEYFQKMSAEPLSVCEKCGGHLVRLLGAGVGIIFKGSGFYCTDYKSKSGSPSSSSPSSSSSSSSSTESKTETKKETKSESKPA